MKIRTLLCTLAASLLMTAAVSAETILLPHRPAYKHVPVIEIDQLPARLENSWVVDVRSAYEFETLHIKDAINIPLGAPTFAKELRQLLGQTPWPIVFYCNGGTCKKSYKAVEKAQKAGITNCVAYDAGIYHWARRYPKQSVLLGKSPMNAKQFISDSNFKNRLLLADEFKKMKTNRSMVLDIRDVSQRDNPLFPFEEKRAQLKDMEKIKSLVRRAKQSNQTLLVYDKVGKQVRWFQYFLEKENVKNYYFMKGGSEHYFEQTLGFDRFTKYRES